MEEDFSEASRFAEEISARLAARGEACRVIVRGSLGSTNSEGLRLLRSGAASPPFAVAALSQSAGRGRLGRRWFSRKGASLAVSVCVGLAKSAEVMESFTVRAGMGVCAELRGLCGAELFIKWPNDIYSRGGMKVAGMLAELEIGADSAAVVFGIGVNVDFSGVAEGEIPEEIRGFSCCLRSLSQGGFSAADVAAAAVAGVLGAEKYLGRTEEEFGKFDWLKGRIVNAEAGAEKFCGEACGVDSRGRLRVALAGGGERLLCGGEATLKKGWRPAP